MLEVNVFDFIETKNVTTMQLQPLFPTVLFPFDLNIRYIKSAASGGVMREKGRSEEGSEKCGVGAEASGERKLVQQVCNEQLDG